MTRILCLGDSVTNGSSGAAGFGGYRGTLFPRLWERYDVRPVGSLGAGSPYGRHEGHDGWRITDALAAIDSIMACEPQILLVILGTNDFYQDYLVHGNVGGYTAANYAAALDNMAALLSAIHVRGTCVRTLVGTIPPVAPDGSWWPAVYNQALPQALQKARESCGADVRLVRACDGLTGSDFYDTVVGHPSASGYVKVATAWYQALVPLLEAS